MYSNFLVISDPVDTMRTRGERVVHTKDLGENLPETAALDSLHTTVKKYQEVMNHFGRTVEVKRLHPYHTRIEIHGRDGSLSAVRDIQLVYYYEDDEEE